MISLDKTMLSDNDIGDALKRHKKYAQYVERLDIVNLSRKGVKKQVVSDNFTIYQTNSLFRAFYIWDAYQIAKKLVDKGDKVLIVTQTPFFTGLVGWLLKIRFGFPLLIHFHGDFWDNKYWLRDRWWLNWALLWLSKFLVKRADGIRVVSLGIKKKLLDKGIPVDRIRVIPTPIDLSVFENYDYERVEERKRGYENLKTIINVGRKDAAKDYKTLFKTIRLIRENYGRIAFCQIGASLKLNEKISNDVVLSSLGKIKQKELTNYYHAADVYISSSRHESFGKVLVEAMACGLPVVATATTGSQSIVIDGENGFLVPIGDHQTLARKAIYLLNNPEVAKKMGAAGQQMVRERFEPKKITGKIIEFWKDLCVS